MNDISREAYDNLQACLDQMADERDAERVLADDLAAALRSGNRKMQDRALARYREARGR